MTLKTLFRVLGIVLLLVVITYLYITFQKTHVLLLENKRQESKIIASNVKDDLLAMMTEMIYKFNSNTKKHKDLYNEIEERIINNPNYSLKEIQKEINQRYKDRTFELFIINKDFIITDTTYSIDKGLDFKNIPSAYNTLKHVYDKKVHMSISTPKIDTTRKNRIQYYVHKSDKIDFMLQLGVIFDKENIIDKYYTNIKQEYSNIITYSIFKINKNSSKNKVLIESLFENRFDYKNTLRIYDKKVYTDFSRIYKNYFHKDIPKNIDIAYSNIKNELLNSKGFLNTSIIDNKKHIVTIISDFKPYSSFQKKFINGYLLVMKFDQSQSIEDIDRFYILNILFISFYIGFILLILYIIFKKIVIPLSKLNEGMESRKIVKLQNITNNKKDEITLIIKTYNKLFNSLNKEIKKNDYLLKENKQFIADMVHQIRTPLTVIMTNSSFIEMKSDESVTKYINQINSSINMLSNSYEDLSYIISNDTIEYKPTNINLSEFLNDRVGFFNTIAVANEKSLISDIVSDINISINDTELERLIDNNISNAIKHSFDNSKITIILKNDNQNIQLQFISSGKSIQNPTKLFDKNYTENNTQRSLGLGLSMVKIICEKNKIKYSAKTDKNLNIFIYTFDN